MSSPSVLGIIPARAGSKRIPHKNTVPLAGKPLIEWIINAALEAKLLSEICVSSDDLNILEIARGYSKVRRIERPAELALDASPAIDYVKHCLEIYAGSQKKKFDWVAILQPTSPFTTAHDIDGTIALLRSHSDFDSAVSIMEVKHEFHPIKFKKWDGLSLSSYFEDEKGRMAAQDLPKAYVRNCAVYVTKVSTIERGQILGDKVLGYLMPSERSLDINDPIDLRFAEFLASENNAP